MISKNNTVNPGGVMRLSIFIKYLLSLAILLNSLLVFSQETMINAPLRLVNYVDTIVINGNIVSMDNHEILSANPGTITQAMAIRDGKIFALGSNDEMLSLAGPGTRVMDVQGKTVVPGFVDTHVHPESTIANAGDDDERAIYQWAPGIHTAVLLQATTEATLDALRDVVDKTKPNNGEWVHILLVPNEETDYPDIGALTVGIYNNFLTMEDFSNVLPNNPATLGIGAGPSAVQQPGVAVRVTVAADGKSQVQAISIPDNAARKTDLGERIAQGENPFLELFSENAHHEAEEDYQYHLAEGCAWVERNPHHLQHCSHRMILLNKLALAKTLEIWPGYITAANDVMSLTENSGDRGFVGGIFQDSGAWEKTVFPPREPRELFNSLIKGAMEKYAVGGTTMIASSIEDGRTLTAFYDLLRKEKRLPVRFGFGYEMLRSPVLYPTQNLLVRNLGAHQSSPEVNPWFWPMGITDGGAGDNREVACFGDDLPGPEILKQREFCWDSEAYRIQDTLIPAVESGWRVFSVHSFGSDAFRKHVEWIEQARVTARMSMDDIRALRIGFAHGGSVGKVPDVMELMVDYNLYVPLKPKDIRVSVNQVKRYGPEGLQFLAPTKTLLEAGVKVVGEADHPVPNPSDYFHDFDLFINRKIATDEQLPGSGGIVMPEEAVSRATAMRLFTSRAAEWLMAESIVGSLEPGKMADFVVMDENFFEVPRDRIVDNKVILTVVGDEIIYQDSEWAPEISVR
jgi:predicted amidohydrolase YtcJ